MAKNTSPEFVLRPFEGLDGEPDLVALREVVPAATATARTTAEHGARDITFTTVLPGAWPALHRADGAVLVALQTHAGSGDASRDLAQTVLDALELEPGASLTSTVLPGPGPRLQDILDPAVPFEVTVHDGFDYWMDPDTEITPDIKASLDEANSTIIETRKLTTVDSAYWCRMGAREYLRWAMPHSEDTVIDAIARLHAKRESGFAGSKFLGAFRASGIVIPVWELPKGSEAEDIEGAVAEFWPSLEAALAVDAPLDADERRARAGIVSRQVTLR
ncbi:DUF5926 family protein [Sanguibacter suaedae]|uniref:Topoisomerase II n=1 Tax=Sanguibacter suaedae TaxID=2795737 RepID=A0A934I7T2_9MICO|nr:DUF5926 family protein [Sanguibacter suaedae]MBI9113572.1 topoisomerase II [Sanguibacter suaedae]